MAVDSSVARLAELGWCSLGPAWRYGKLGMDVSLAEAHAEKYNMRKIICPCADCKNKIAWDFDDAFKVKEHLVTRGFMDKYEIWTRHGEEQVDGPENVDPIQVEDMVHDDGFVEDKIDLEEMLRHAEPEVLMGSARGLNNFEALQEAKEVLYDESKGCDSEFTTLRSVLELMRLKARHGWSNTSFDSLLELLQKMLPRSNSLPSIHLGPRQPGIDIDVFLELLLEDMADLWKEGLKVWDEYLREYFTVKAIMFVTINDYPAMFSVSGQIKGKTGFMICLNGTYYRYLPGSNKLVYMRHRRFLCTNHKYRKMKAEFDGTEETDPTPKPTSGEKVCAMIEKIVCEFGKVTKKPSKGTKRKKPEKNTKQGDSKKQDDSSKPDDKLPPPFKKHSIFFKYLPY
uniref:Transposon protein, putative, CACTA, En/Spm sub-class n=1 Tax=Oryza sativa subsp. japonica TaxID=39947 RepID=Q10HD2_ORYSJ|nr:transposon protein, putative, CACTA, En/Spm sub-class [Oryza sativa Japonica Group]